MTIEEIRANAPEGATHYVQYKRFTHFLKRIGFVYMLFSGNKWIMARNDFLEKYSIDIKPL